MSKRGAGRLNSAASRRAFIQRYGAKKGARVFGATIGKVRREQFENGTKGPYAWVPSHPSKSKRGRRFRVRGHRMRVEH